MPGGVLFFFSCLCFESFRIRRARRSSMLVAYVPHRASGTCKLSIRYSALEHSTLGNCLSVVLREMESMSVVGGGLGRCREHERRIDTLCLI